MSDLEFEGKDTEEAILNAAKALNLPPEKVHFVILSMGSRGFLGLGRRKARIRLNPDQSRRPEEEPRKAPERERKPAGKALRNQSPRPEKDQPVPAKKSRADEAPPEKALDLNWEEIPPPMTQPGPGESWAEGPPDEAAVRAREITAEILRLMDLTADIKVGRIGSRIILSLDSPEGAMLIGRRGGTLEALEFLVNRLAHPGGRDGKTPEERIVVDVADYRARRQAFILENALALAREVHHGRGTRTLSHLSSTERRLVHLALKPLKGLTTQSQGNGPYRDLLITRISPRSRGRRPR